MKRKRAPTPAAANQHRKRTRLSEAPVTNARRQQTLTQAQWVPSRPPSFQDETMLRRLEPGRRRNNARSLSKRDSTLTQMDFFNPMNVQPWDVDGTPLYDNSEAALKIPQVDGAYDSPRKPRPRKSTTLMEMKEGVQGTGEESQEYIPLSKRQRRNYAPESSDCASRRTSGRLADKKKQMKKVLSDPVNNYDYFERALSGSPAKSRAPNSPVLEIQDSTAMNDEIAQLPSQPQTSTRSAAPRTPQRSKTIVLSSQSPESLPPTVGKLAVETDVLDRPMRSPLRERSINLPSVRSARTQKSWKKTRSRQATPKSSKIVSLKLPKQTLQSSKSRVEDSQNIWSLPLTSSPEKKQHSLRGVAKPKNIARDDHSPELVRVQSNPTEIPGTSQANQEALESPEESAALPSLNVLLGYQATALHASTVEVQSDLERVGEQQPRSEVVVGDFAQQISPAPVPHLDQPEGREHLHTPDKRVSAVIADSESEFDSPIANDTQFNEELARRTSSPNRVSEDSHKMVSTEILSDATIKLKAAIAGRLMANDALDVDEEALLMPTPRLIRSSSRPPSREEVKSDPSSEEGLLPPPSIPAAHRTRTQTTRVPLNDALPSSSPPLQSHRSITQRSMVRPASMPHPSQISTQEATQYGMSSMIVDEPSETPPKTERITIKDSSSIRLSLSQIPAHGGSQAGLNVDLRLDALEEDGDDEEFDLNPPSTSEQEAPIVTNDNITRPASKRKADHSPIQSPIINRRRTPSQIPPIREETDSSSSEDEIDLDPNSSHSTVRPYKSIPHNAGDSQDYISTAGTTSNVPDSRDQTSATQPTTHPESDEPQKLPGPPQYPSQSQSESIASSPPLSSGKPSPLRKEYPPLAGFNNETQSNFTQGGHVSAAYIHRQREKGVLPQWYTPKPYKVPGYTRR